MHPFMPCRYDPDLTPPIVFITGYEEGKLIERLKSVTLSTYLIKPIAPKALESAITQALQNNRGLKV